MITTRRRPLLSSRRFVLSSSQHQLETRHLWHTTASHYTETISVLCYTCPACYTCHTDILSSHEVPGPISNDTHSWWGVYRSLCQHREKCANNIQLQRSLYFTCLCNFMYFLRIFHHLAGMFYHRCTAQLSPDNAEYIATTGPLSITVHQGSERRNLAQL